MNIEVEPLKHWLNYFYGYGSLQAPFWFIAWEDGGGDLPEDVAARLNYFYQEHQASKEATLCNLRDLYSHVPARVAGASAKLVDTLFDYRLGKHATQHGTWKNLIAFVHGYENKVLPNLLEYQKKKFTTPRGAEAWIQLYPLPSPHNHAWYYSWLNLPKFEFLKSRERYQHHFYNYRIRAILQKIIVHQPKVVLFYGMNNITALKKSVLEVFPGNCFKSVKAIPRIIPSYHIVELKETKLLLTTQVPTLRHNRIETGFDWHKFGKLLRAGAT